MRGSSFLGGFGWTQHRALCIAAAPQRCQSIRARSRTSISFQYANPLKSTVLRPSVATLGRPGARGAILNDVRSMRGPRRVWLKRWAPFWNARTARRISAPPYARSSAPLGPTVAILGRPWLPTVAILGRPGPRDGALSLTILVRQSARIWCWIALFHRIRWHTLTTHLLV